MGNIPPGGRGAAGGFLQRGRLSPWHPPGPPGLGRSWSDHQMLIEGAALQSGAGGVLSHGERLVQSLGARLRSPILFHRIMGHQHQAQSYGGKNEGASNVRGNAPTAEDGRAGLVGHSGRLFALGNSHLKQTPFCSC